MSRECRGHPSPSRRRPDAWVGSVGLVGAACVVLLSIGMAIDRRRNRGLATRLKQV